jgi:hypothetical protein
MTDLDKLIMQLVTQGIYHERDDIGLPPHITIISYFMNSSILRVVTFSSQTGKQLESHLER